MNLKKKNENENENAKKKLRRNAGYKEKFSFFHFFTKKVM
jgi:hypothetical protein